MRNMYRKLEYEQKTILSQNPGAGAEAPDRQKSVHDAAKSKGNKDGGVGDLEEKGEFGLGKAPKNDRPQNKIEISK